MSRKQIIDPGNNLWLDIPAKFTPVSMILPKTLGYEAWSEIGLKLCRVKTFCTWALCDWLNFGEAKYGETFSQAADATGLQPDYLAILKYVRLARGRLPTPRESVFQPPPTRGAAGIPGTRAVSFGSRETPLDPR